MVTGIIGEYNPFHKGHKYHIDKTKELTVGNIITVLGGNFTQRGECSLIEKDEKVKYALNAGSDLVIELPLPWCISSAEGFAFGGVSLLEKTGICDSISFGSECGDSDIIMKTAEILLDNETDGKIAFEMNKGVAYPTARRNVINEIYGEKYASVIVNSNDILGVEYCKAIKRLGSNIKPIAIKRVGNKHNSENEKDGYLSASEIRKRVRNGIDVCEFMPDGILFDKNEVHDMSLIENGILSVLRKMNVEDIKKIPDVSEGLEYRIFDCIKKSAELNELYENIKTKRYTMSRIKRIILCAYLGIDKNYAKEIPPYIRVLGFNENGKSILKEMKEKSKLPIVTRYSDICRLDDYAKEIFNTECIGTDLFELAKVNKGICNREKTRKMQIIQP